VLEDAPSAHDQRLVADVLDHADVVGDEQQGQAALALQVEQELEDLGLASFTPSPTMATRRPRDLISRILAAF
jgi:hypothetical protein